MLSPTFYTPITCSLNQPPSPNTRSGFKTNQAGIIVQNVTDEFGKPADVPTIKLEQNGFPRTEILLCSKGTTWTVGYITGTLPEGMECNVISGKDGPFIQLMVPEGTKNALKPLAGKSLIIPAGGSVKLGSPFFGFVNPFDKRAFEAALYKNDKKQPPDFSAKDYEPLQDYCKMSDPTPYQAETNEDEEPLTFWANFPIGGAGSRLFPLSSPDVVEATLEDGTKRYALPAGGKPAGWLPCDGKSMAGRSLYYLALAGVTTILAPTVNSSAPKSIQQTLRNAKANVADKLNIDLDITQIKEDRLGGQSSYLPDLWKDKVEILSKDEKKNTYIINEFPDATYFPYPPYQEMIKKVQEAYNDETPLDGLVLVKPVEDVEALVKKYGETTYNKCTGELLGMHEKPKSVEEAKRFAQEDRIRYNTKHPEDEMTPEDEGIGFRLGTEIYSSNLLKVTCSEQKDGHELLADRDENGNVKLVNNKPIYSMYNVFHAIGEDAVGTDGKPLNVQVMELPKTYQWADMGNYFGYLNTVRQLTYCNNADVLRYKKRGVPYPIGGKMQRDKDTKQINREALYGKGVIDVFDKVLSLQTTGAVALVGSQHTDTLSDD